MLLQKCGSRYDYEKEIFQLFCPYCGNGIPETKKISYEIKKEIKETYNNTKINEIRLGLYLANLIVDSKYRKEF